MNTIQYSNINFGAKFIKRETISRFDDTKKQGYLPVDVSLVELNPKNKQDIDATKKLITSWGRDDEFGYYILDDLMALKDDNLSPSLDRIYAITLQSKDFKNLDHKKILGLGEITRRSYSQAEINYLQVEPKSTFLKGSKNFINIGKTLVEYFMSKNFKELIVKSTYKAATFYERMGFEIFDTKELIYSWQKILKK